MSTNEKNMIELLAEASDRELIEYYNRQVGNLRWTPVRITLMYALRNELEQRNLDISRMFLNGAMMVKQKMHIVDGTVEPLPPVEDLSVEKATASVYLGLGKGFTGELQDSEQYLRALQDYQSRLRKVTGNRLSATVSPVELLNGGLREPHLQLKFINMPDSRMDQQHFENEVRELAEAMLHECGQHRVLIEYADRVCILQNTEDTDPRIDP